MIDINELRRLALDGDLAAMQEIILRLEAAEKSDAESIAMYRKARDERDALRAEIEELHALIAAVKRQARAEFCLRVKKEEEYVRLRARVEAMERQEPGFRERCTPSSPTGYSNRFPLYALPGAQTQGEGK